MSTSSEDRRLCGDCANWAEADILACPECRRRGARPARWFWLWRWHMVREYRRENVTALNPASLSDARQCLQARDGIDHEVNP